MRICGFADLARAAILMYLRVSYTIGWAERTRKVQYEVSGDATVTIGGQAGDKEARGKGVTMPRHDNLGPGLCHGYEVQTIHRPSVWLAYKIFHTFFIAHASHSAVAACNAYKVPVLA